MASRNFNGKISLPSFLKGRYMPIDKERIAQRIAYLVDVAEKSGDDTTGAGEVISGVIGILQSLYGSESLQCKAYVDRYNLYIQNAATTRFYLYEMMRSSIGTLKSIRSEMEAGLIGKLELQAQGGIFGDFILLAKTSIDENKDVAAVLASAALEDALKRFALQNALDVADANMEQVINALASKGLLKGPQVAIAKGHKELRQKAFHANWAKIDSTSVSSAIAFTESFILENFGSK